MRRISILIATVAASAACLGAITDGVSAAGVTRCPSGGTPALGSFIPGGVEVDGICELTGVTITGGITVDPTSVADFASGVVNAAVLNGSTVSGGILSMDGSAVITGTDLGANLTHQHTTINGRVTLETPSLFGFADTTLRGGLATHGSFDWPLICGGDPFCFSGDPLCNDEIFGDVSILNDSTDQIIVGEAGEAAFPNGDCTGNVIHGSVLMKNASFVRFDGEPSEIEGNTVTGSIHVDNSRAEVNENIVGGSLLCTNGTVIHPGAPPDHQGNTVRGKDTCD